MRKSRVGTLAVASVLVGGLAAVGAPALADSAPVNITYALSAGCTSCRTLEVDNNDGTPISGLDLSSGSGGFLAKVHDPGIDPAALGNFYVTATMSNLYKYTAGRYDCSVSIPSGDMTLNSSPALLDASGLSASVQPIFSLTGDLTKVTLPILGTPLTQINMNPTVPDVTGDVSSALNQVALSGNAAVDLIGSSLPSNLPVTLGTGTGGAFTNPDTPPDPSCGTNTATATAVPVMTGVLSSSPLLGEIQTKLNGSSLATLVSQGFLTSDQALTLVENATKIAASDFQVIPTLLSTLEPAFTATVTGLLDGATSITGNYASSPLMAISAPNATPTDYQGVLTVTLTSGNPLPGL